jgi:Tol biopolymer transport system component
VWIDDEHSAIELLDLDTGETRRLASAAGRMYGNAWAPDGSFLLYNDDSDGDQEIYSIPSTGGHPRKLTDNDVPDHLAMVAPDARSAVYTSETDEGEQVWMLDLESGRSRRLELGW